MYNVYKSKRETWVSQKKPVRRTQRGGEGSETPRTCGRQVASSLRKPSTTKPPELRPVSTAQATGGNKKVVQRRHRLKNRKAEAGPQTVSDDEARQTALASGVPRGVDWGWLGSKQEQSCLCGADMEKQKKMKRSQTLCGEPGGDSTWLCVYRCSSIPSRLTATSLQLFGGNVSSPPPVSFSVQCAETPTSGKGREGG